MTVITNAAANNIEATTLAPETVPSAVKRLVESGGRMQMAYAWYPEPKRIELRYLGSRADKQGFVVWRCLPQGRMPSCAGISPLLGWYEREIVDLCGVEFVGHPEPERLVLHHGASPPQPPLDPEYPADQAIPHSGARRRTPEIESADVQRLPFGPIRADVVESVGFTFLYVGEQIVHFHPHLFYKHRGMEKRFAGRSLSAATVLAERVSGVGSLAHALAFCQAVEAASGCAPPRRALLARTLLAELERLYNHLHYLGHLADATTLKVGNAEGKLLEERVKQVNGRLTGSRFLRGILCPGGLRHDIAPHPWLAEALDALHQDIATYTAMLESTNSYRDRLITTGILDRRVALDQGATGPIERGSGLDRDLRRDHPYAAYGDLPPRVTVKMDGDAHAREQVRIAEIDASIALMRGVLALLEPGPVRIECRPPAGSEGLSWAESPRGSLFYAVHFGGDGRLCRVKIKSPSFSNWRVFPFTVHASNMMDYAINEASFGLTVAGCDR